MELESLKAEVAELKAGDNKELKYYSLGDDIIWQSEKLAKGISVSQQAGYAVFALDWLFYPETDGIVKIEIAGNPMGDAQFTGFFNAADMLENVNYYTNNQCFSYRLSILKLFLPALLDGTKGNILQGVSYGINFNTSNYIRFAHLYSNEKGAIVQKGLPLVFFVGLQNNYSNSSQSYNFSDFQITITGTKNY